MSDLLAFYLSTLLLLAPLLVCVGIGTVWSRRSLPYSGDFVSRLVTSVCVPALVFRTLVLTDMDNALLIDVGLVTVLALALAVAGCWVALHVMRLPVRELVMTAAFPNSGNLGLPMAALAFGEAGFSGAIVFFAVTAFVHNTFGVRLLPGANAGSIWRSPVLIASMLAVICRAGGIPVPAWVMESLELLGRLTVPLMLFSLGFALATIPASGLRSGAVVGVMRLVVGGASGWLAAWLMGLDGQIQSLMFMQMAMPCAVFSYMFTARYSNKAEVTAGAVLVSTVVFLVASPLIMMMAGAPIATGR